MPSVDFLLLVALAQVPNAICVFFHAARLRLALLPVHLGLFESFRITTLYFGASAVLPARLGELVRPVLLLRTHNIPLSRSAAAIIHLQLSEVVVLALLFAYLSGKLWMLVQVELRAFMLSPVYFLIPAVLLLLMAVFWGKVKHRLMPFIASVYQSFMAGVAIPKLLLNITVTVVTWCFSLVTLSVVLTAFRIGFDFDSLLLILFAMIVGGLIPLLPGSLGTFEAGVILGLRYLNVSLSDAFYISVVLRFTIFSAPLIYLLTAFGFHFKQKLLR